MVDRYDEFTIPGTIGWQNLALDQRKFHDIKLLKSKLISFLSFKDKQISFLIVNKNVL